MSPYNFPPSENFNETPPTPIDPHSVPLKRPTYDSNYENMIYRAGYSNMQNEYIYNQQRSQALHLQANQRQQARTSPAFSLFSSSESYPSTPSTPDYSLHSSQGGASSTPSPLFMGYHPQTTVAVVEPPPLRYFQPSSAIAIACGKSPAEHNYAIASPRGGGSSSTIDARSTSNSPELSMARPIRGGGRTSSDSGNSTMPDEINPLCMNDWFRDTLKPELRQKLQVELAKIEAKSVLQKEQYLAVKMNELPTDLEYNPNKSRLRKTYENPTEAAERERNNLASRRSRFKKKIAQQITNMHLEFDRAENAELYAMQNWMGQMIFELESLCLDNGLASESLCELRQQCGFPQNQLDKAFAPGPVVCSS